MEINTSVLETPGMLEVRVQHAFEVDDALAKAIDVVQKAATEHRTGILVIRIDAGRYIVRAHPAVPFGLVRQQHEPESAPDHPGIARRVVSSSDLRTKSADAFSAAHLPA